MKKGLFIVALLIATFLTARYFFFYDNVVDSGSGYGFSIGMPKNEAAAALNRDYSEENLSIILTKDISRNDMREILYLDFSQFNSSISSNMNVWQLRFNKADTNVLILYFSGDKLTKMDRYRRAFIL